MAITLKKIYETDSLADYVMSTKEASDFLGIDKATLGRWRESNKIKKIALKGLGEAGTNWYWRADIEALAAARATA